MASGLDGGLDGGGGAGGGGLPSPPIPDSPFAAHVARLDRLTLAYLGSVEVTYVSSTPGGTFPVAGIFDDNYVLSSTGDSLAGVETVGPAVFILLADLPIDPELDDPTLTIRGVTYRVTARPPAGMGSVLLILRKVT